MSDCKEHGYYPYDDSRPCPYCRITELEAGIEVERVAGDAMMDTITEQKARLEAVKPMYIAINNMMAVLGAKGEIHATDEKANQVMSALADLDGGVYDVDKFMQALEVK
jgi:hypothetical protein